MGRDRRCRAVFDSIVSNQAAGHCHGSDPGWKLYLAPPDYHLLVEPGRSFSLSSDSPSQLCTSLGGLAIAQGMLSFGRLREGFNVLRRRVRS